MADFAGECHHAFAHCGQDDWGLGAGGFLGGVAFDEIAGVGQRFAGGDAHADVAGAVGDADAEAEAAGGDFVHEGGGGGEVADGAGVDRRDGGAEGDGGGVPGQCFAERHVGAEAGAEQAGVAAAFDFLGEFDHFAAAAGDGDEGDGWLGGGHGDSPGLGCSLARVGLVGRGDNITISE